jgi:hypothetical protein
MDAEELAPPGRLGPRLETPHGLARAPPWQSSKGVSRTSPTTKGRRSRSTTRAFSSRACSPGGAVRRMPSRRCGTRSGDSGRTVPGRTGRVPISAGWTATTPPSSSGACSGP